MKKTVKRLAAAAAALLFVLFACSLKLAVRDHTLPCAGLSDEFTFCVVSDLHNSFFGKGQQTLLTEIHRQHPDALLITGDVCSGMHDMQAVAALLEGLGGAYPVYYVTGNHENDTGELDRVKQRMKNLGAQVLENDSILMHKGESTLRICGLDDPISLTKRDWSDRLESLRSQAADDIFTLLLSHRPDRIDRYHGFDLVLCGHAHGGQVRIPGLLNGLWAPNQGWFPKYAGGLYTMGETQMIVSRGLSKDWLPRIFNRPELVIVRLIPEA